MLVSSLACAVIIATAVVLDHRAGIRRDWLHASGVLVAFLLATMEWVRYFRVILSE